MKFHRRQIDHWPKLSWYAAIAADTLTVFHGCRVEYSDEWVFEGTWAGDFSQGDFDLDTPVIFGSGIRLRDNRVSFVCSTTPLDRLFYVEKKSSDELMVSNSLACLLALTNLHLDHTFPYSQVLSDYIKSHQHQAQSLQTLEGDKIHVLIYEKLVYSGTTGEQPRTDAGISFSTFEHYEHFLSNGITAIRDNLQDEHRRHKVTPVTTISSGYDSAASTVVAQPLGISSALTISRIGVFSQHDDSGQVVARELGISVKSVVSNSSGYSDHDLVWAGLGQAHDLNMTLFDYPDDLTILVVGTHGDVVWQKGLKQKFIESHHFLDRNGDTSGCGLTEWRLHKGVFLACVPCIGACRLDCLKLINESAAMDPWRVGGDYDRPIPRRIVEQTGVKREKFGRKKLATIPGYRMFYPSDASLYNDLHEFLKQHGRRLPRRLGKLHVPLHILRAKAGDLAFKRKRKWKSLAPLALPDFDDLFFIWANSRLAKNSYSRES